MATVRKGKTDMEGNVFTTTGKGGRRREGFPYSALSSLLSGGAPGLGCASPPLPAFSGGGGHLVYGEGYSSSALVIASLILLLHPCGMPA